MQLVELFIKLHFAVALLAILIPWRIRIFTRTAFAANAEPMNQLPKMQMMSMKLTMPESYTGLLDW